ncbi:MAG: hypothetical protein HC765_12430 [Brachymonas sp.]|nr:hypothetical protein [Brachymonas sp.]
MQASDFDEQSLGNLLLGLYLSGIIALEIDAGVDTLFASSARPPSRDTLH